MAQVEDALRTLRRRYCADGDALPSIDARVPQHSSADVALGTRPPPADAQQPAAPLLGRLRAHQVAPVQPVMSGFFSSPGSGGAAAKATPGGAPQSLIPRRACALAAIPRVALRGLPAGWQGAHALPTSTGARAGAAAAAPRLARPDAAELQPEPLTAPPAALACSAPLGAAQTGRVASAPALRSPAAQRFKMQQPIGLPPALLLLSPLPGVAAPYGSARSARRYEHLSAGPPSADESGCARATASSHDATPEPPLERADFATPSSAEEACAERGASSSSSSSCRGRGIPPMGLRAQGAARALDVAVGRPARASGELQQRELPLLPASRSAAAVVEGSPPLLPAQPPSSSDALSAAAEPSPPAATPSLGRASALAGARELRTCAAPAGAEAGSPAARAPQGLSRSLTHAASARAAPWLAATMGAAAPAARAAAPAERSRGAAAPAGRTPRRSAPSGQRRNKQPSADEHGRAAAPPPSAPVDAMGGGCAQEEWHAWLVQKQFELMLSIRAHVDSAQALRELRASVRSLSAFLAHVGDAARAASVQRVHIVQDLLLRLQGAQLPFDSQAGTAAIPMHQAKVLDRSAALQELKLEEQMSVSEIGAMVAAMGELRRLLKVKIEDGNDLLMAERTLEELGLFFDRLAGLAAHRQCSEHELYVSLLA